MTEIGHEDENKWPEGCAGTEAFFLPSKRVAQGILVFKSAWRDGDSQSKPRHQTHVPEVPCTCPKQPEWQVLSIYRRPVRKSVTALCRMQLMNCQDHHMPALAPSLPPFLPHSLRPPPPSLSQYLSNTACRNRRHGRWWNGKHLSRSICHSIHVDRQARRPTGNEEWERLSAKRKELSKKIQKIRSKEKENDKVSML